MKGFDKGNQATTVYKTRLQTDEGYIIDVLV